MEQIFIRFHGLSHWQIGLLATMLLAQGFAISIFPEELVILTLGALSASGRIGFGEALGFLILGLLPANLTTVLIAQKLGILGLRKRPFTWLFKESAIQAFLKPARMHAKKIVVATRFIPLIRGPIYAALGISGIAPLSFLRLDAMAACIQVPLWLYLGSVGAKLSAQQLANTGECVIAILIFLFIAFKLRNREWTSLWEKVS